MRRNQGSGNMSKARRPSHMTLTGHMHSVKQPFFMPAIHIMQVHIFVMC